MLPKHKQTFKNFAETNIDQRIVQKNRKEKNEACKGSLLILDTHFGHCQKCVKVRSELDYHSRPLRNQFCILYVISAYCV